MSDETLASQDVEAVTTQPPSEAASLSQETETQQQERDWESEARETGWKPESEWRGPKPDKFISAQEWVEKGQTFIPYLRGRVGKLEEELKAKDKEMEDRLARIEKASNRGIENMKRQHEKEVERVRKEMREAVAAGDTERFDRLETQRDELLKSSPDAEPEAETDGGDPVFNEWVGRNSWYRDDFEANQMALNYSQWIAQKDPSITLKENLRRTEEYMRDKRPELFGGRPQTRGSGHAAVDGGGTINGLAPTRSKTPLFDKLPEDAKRVARDAVASGTYETVEAWAKVYNS